MYFPNVNIKELQRETLIFGSMSKTNFHKNDEKLVIAQHTSKKKCKFTAFAERSILLKNIVYTLDFFHLLVRVVIYFWGFLI